MRSRLRIVAILSVLCWPEPAGAQAVSIGTIQVAANTGLVTNRQTVETTGVTPESGIGQIGITSIRLGAEVSYFITPRVSLGGTASVLRVSFDVPENDVLAYSSAAHIGPLIQLRLPLGDRSAFVFSGSVGGVRTTLTNRNTGVGGSRDITAYGRYWMGGGGVSIEIAANASFDAVVRFQSSTFTSPDGRPGTVTASGLLANIGFSVYVGRR